MYANGHARLNGWRLLSLPPAQRPEGIQPDGMTRRDVAEREERGREDLFGKTQPAPVPLRLQRRLQLLQDRVTLQA